MRAHCQVIAEATGVSPHSSFQAPKSGLRIVGLSGLLMAAMLPRSWSAETKSASDGRNHIAFDQKSSTAEMADVLPSPQAARAACDRAIAALLHANAVAETVEVFEGLPHPFEREALAAEKQKPTRQFDDQLFYAAAQPLSAGQRAELKTWIGADTFVPYRGMKLCGGFHADYAVRWTWNKGSNETVLLVCFGCGEARVLAAARDTADLAGSGKPLRSFFSAFRKERPERATPRPNSSR